MRQVLSLFFSVSLFACGAAPSPAVPAGDVDAALLSAMEELGGGRYDANTSLRDGRHVALVFWQPWCVACLEEIPALLRAQTRHAGRLQVVGIVSGPDGAVDDELVRARIREHSISYPTIRDRALDLTRRFAIESTPTIVVLDPDRRVVYQGHHVPDWPELW